MVKPVLQVVFNRRPIRDTAWFAMLDMDWPTIKDNLQDWLYHSQAYFSLTARQAAKPRLAQHPTELE